MNRGILLHLLLDGSPSLVLLVHTDLISVSLMLTLPGKIQLLSTAVVQGDQNVGTIISNMQRDMVISHLLASHMHL